MGIRALPPGLGSSDVIVMIDLGSLFWGKDITEVKCSSRHSVSEGMMPTR